MNYEGSNYSMYYGLCFTNSCNTEDMNNYATPILESIFNKSSQMELESANFIQPSFKKTMNSGAIVLYCIFIALFILFMTYSVIKWGQQCLNGE